MRKTDWNLEELKSILEEGKAIDCSKGLCLAAQRCGGIPTGFIYNEIGAIFEEKGEESAVAEEFLLQCLRGSEEEKFYGYGYLSRSVVKSPEIEVVLREFEENPMNQETIQTVKKTKRRD